MIGWILNGKIRKEIRYHLTCFHNHLSHSFLNIKNDIANIHSHLNHKDKRIMELEEKIKHIETKLFYAFQLKEERPKQIEVSGPELESDIKILENLSISEVTDLTYTQKAILKALYELQIHLDSPISFKSLAKYLYPSKKYGSVRTTLSEYIDNLSTYNLVKKDKVGRETVANVTQKGKKLAKELSDKKKQKLNLN
jgi:DNA-binding MarR family transcriptional regulator